MNASSSLAKRAAAVAASGWTKLLVRKSASEFSPHELGGRPSRTGSVSRRVPGGSSTRGIFPALIPGPARSPEGLWPPLRGAANVVSLRAPSGRLGRAAQRQAPAIVVRVFLVSLRAAL